MAATPHSCQSCFSCQIGTRDPLSHSSDLAQQSPVRCSHAGKRAVPGKHTGSSGVLCMSGGRGQQGNCPRRETWASRPLRTRALRRLSGDCDSQHGNQCGLSCYLTVLSTVIRKEHSGTTPPPKFSLRSGHYCCHQGLEKQQNSEGLSSSSSCCKRPTA